MSSNKKNRNKEHHGGDARSLQQKVPLDVVSDAPEKSPIEYDIEMLKYFQEEFLYRHRHFWDILVKSFLLVVVVALLPISGEVLGLSLDDVPTSVQLCFPVLGIVISIFSTAILLGENKRMTAVNDAKYYLNRRFVEEKHQYYFFDEDTGKVKDSKKEKKKLKNLLSYKIVWSVLFLEVIINLAVLAVILFVNDVDVSKCCMDTAVCIMSRF